MVFCNQCTLRCQLGWSLLRLNQFGVERSYRTIFALICAFGSANLYTLKEYVAILFDGIMGRKPERKWSKFFIKPRPLDPKWFVRIRTDFAVCELSEMNGTCSEFRCVSDQIVCGGPSKMNIEKLINLIIKESFCDTYFFNFDWLVVFFQ